MKKMERKMMVSVSVDSALAKALRDIATQRGITVTEAARTILLEATSGGVVDLKGELSYMRTKLDTLTADLAIVKRDVAPTVKATGAHVGNTASGQPVPVEAPPDAYANWLKKSKPGTGAKPA